MFNVKRKYESPIRLEYRNNVYDVNIRWEGGTKVKGKGCVSVTP